MQHSTDPKGRLFIDRDPELFAVLLQFLRAHTLPPQSYVKTHRQALLEECKFFQIAHLEHYLCGHTSKFDLRLEDRQIKERESDVRSTCEDRSFLLNVFETCTLPRDANELEVPLLKPARKRAEVNCSSFATFCSRYRTLTHGLADAIASTSGVVFAGGSVLSALTQREAGDVDIFLTCELGEARSALTQIYDAVRSLEVETKQNQHRLLVTRSKHALTIFRVCDGGSRGLPIQVILSVYKSVAHLLSSFDVDSCAVAFVPGKGVYCTPRCLRALRHSVNIFDSDLETATYCHRLEKYDARGFQIALPGLVSQRVSRSIKEGVFYRLASSSLLLRLLQTPHYRVNESVNQHCRIIDNLEYFWTNYVRDGDVGFSFTCCVICCVVAQAPGSHEVRRECIAD